MPRELDALITSEQAALRRRAREFARDVVRPAAAVLDHMADPAALTAPSSPLWRVFREAYRLGYHRVLLPAEVGGLGFGGLEQHLLFEELGWGSADLAMAIGIAAVPFVVAAQTGNPDLIEQYVRPFAEDVEARTIGCWAITEPEHGSDTFMLGTPQFHDPRISGNLIARLDREYYVLTGEKAAWVSNGAIATHALTFVALDPGQGMAGGGVAIVPLRSRGVSRGKPFDKLGQRALSQSELVFDEVRIHESEMITDSSLYELFLDRTITLVDGLMSAVFTGLARAAYEAALDYSRKRVQGGKAICEHQLVQKRLFDMFARVEACRALSRATVIRNHAAGPPATELALAAKTFCTETALAVADGAVQLFGANGLTREYPVEKLLRDARASLVQHGSNEILALVGARRLIAAAGGPVDNRGRLA
jgi:alkylation response protein AidB-like acyl-CoA dehydrogenase